PQRRCKMYDNLRRWGGTGAIDAHARIRTAEIHRGSAADFLRRHELEAAAAVHGDDKLRDRVVSKLFTRTADSRNLKCAWDYLASGDSETAGVDGMRYGDLDSHEVWDLCRVASKAIGEDTYRPAPDRNVKIPKTSGNGSRTIQVQTIVDRIVGRAVLQILQP